MIIREEAASDWPLIRAVDEAAFPGPGEARLVDRLRVDGDAVYSLVAVEADAIAGHAMLSRMTAPFKALGLGPVAVLPARQRCGIGGQLIRDGLSRAAREGWHAVSVLGDPEYYKRFGFDVGEAADFTCRYAGPHFMIAALQVRLAALSGIVEYPPAFGLVD